jgi:hypothetical protein
MVGRRPSRLSHRFVRNFNEIFLVLGDFLMSSSETNLTLTISTNGITDFRHIRKSISFRDFRSFYSTVESEMLCSLID